MRVLPLDRSCTAYLVAPALLVHFALIERNPFLLTVSRTGEGLLVVVAGGVATGGGY